MVSSITASFIPQILGLVMTYVLIGRLAQIGLQDANQKLVMVCSYNASSFRYALAGLLEIQA